MQSSLFNLHYYNLYKELLSYVTTSMLSETVFLFPSLIRHHSAAHLT